MKLMFLEKPISIKNSKKNLSNCSKIMKYKSKTIIRVLLRRKSTQTSKKEPLKFQMAKLLKKSLTESKWIDMMKKILKKLAQNGDLRTRFIAEMWIDNRTKRTLNFLNRIWKRQRNMSDSDQIAKTTKNSPWETLLNLMVIRSQSKSSDWNRKEYRNPEGNSIHQH